MIHTEKKIHRQDREVIRKVMLLHQIIVVIEMKIMIIMYQSLALKNPKTPNALFLQVENHIEYRKKGRLMKVRTEMQKRIAQKD